MVPNETDNKKKGRFKRVGGMTAMLAAVILIVLVKMYPLVQPPALATFAVLLALFFAALINFILERRKQ